MVPLLVLSACHRAPEEAAPVVPSLVVDSPAPAACVPVAPLTVTGRAPGLGALTVDGIATPVALGRFSQTLDPVRGIDTFEVRGTDADGHDRYVRESVLAGDFAPADGR